MLVFAHDVAFCLGDVERHYLPPDDQAAGRCAVPALTGDLRGVPPARVVPGQVDPLRDEGLGYGMRLCAAGVPTEIHNHPGTFHAFDAAAPALPIARRASDGQVEFLRTVLVQ